MTDEEENDSMLEMDDGFDMAESANDEDISEPVTARERLREQLAGEVAAYLANGGRIDYIESNVLADPPRKPPCNYGGQPL